MSKGKLYSSLSLDHIKKQEKEVKGKRFKSEKQRTDTTIEVDGSIRLRLKTWDAILVLPNGLKLDLTQKGVVAIFDGENGFYVGTELYNGLALPHVYRNDFEGPEA